MLAGRGAAHAPSFVGRLRLRRAGLAADAGRRFRLRACRETKDDAQRNCGEDPAHSGALWFCPPAYGMAVLRVPPNWAFAPSAGNRAPPHPPLARLASVVAMSVAMSAVEIP